MSQVCCSVCHVCYDPATNAASCPHGPKPVMGRRSFGVSILAVAFVPFVWMKQAKASRAEMFWKGAQPGMMMFTPSTEADAVKWEKLVKPPLSGGDLIETTTMRNHKWRTHQPRTLVDPGR